MKRICGKIRSPGKSFLIECCFGSNSIPNADAEKSEENAEYM